MNKSNLINYCLLGLFVAAAVFMFIIMIIWGYSLPQTALLWNRGPVSGWILLITYSTIFSFMLFLPALMIWDEIEINNRNAKRIVKLNRK